MDYPAPDRSDHVPNFSKSDENDIVDLGWGEGTLADGRTYRAELWAQDQVTVLTFFLSTQGLESLDRDALIAFVANEGLVTWRGSKRFLGPGTVQDASGHEMWSLNVIIGDEDEVYADSPVRLHGYR